jgi:TIR domain/SIR2-like domain
MDTSDSLGIRDDSPAAGPAELPLKVFINYRHDDTQATAWTLYIKLEARFGAENVFFDKGTLRPGTRWLSEIKSQLAEAGAFIALIGPDWMSGLTARLRRGSEDYVAEEIDLALRGRSHLTVIPVLIEDAELPEPGKLPAALRALPGHQQERLRYTNLSDDIDRLIARLSTARAEPGAGPGAEPEQVSALKASPPALRPSRLSAPRPVASLPDEDHYRMIARQAGNLVVFVGAGANADDHDGPWSEGSGKLPDDRDLARYLSSHAGLQDAPLHLAEAAQYAGAVHGEMTMFQWVKQALGVESEPSPVHRYLASLPARLGNRYQMIVTPKYDSALEKAFREADERFDVAVYMAPGTTEQGKFVHLPWKALPQTISVPNHYRDFPIIAGEHRLERTIIVRINGGIDDPSAGFPWEDNYVITEDHYIDYLSGSSATEVIPGQLLAKLKRANYLFLGYTIADWRLRVFLQRIWTGPKLGRAKYWAVEREPDALTKDLWQQAGVSLYQSSLTDYLEGLYDFLDDHPDQAQP